MCLLIFFIMYLPTIFLVLKNCHQAISDSKPQMQVCLYTALQLLPKLLDLSWHIFFPFGIPVRNFCDVFIFATILNKGLGYQIKEFQQVDFYIFYSFICFTISKYYILINIICIWVSRIVTLAEDCRNSLFSKIPFCFFDLLYTCHISSQNIMI